MAGLSSRHIFTPALSAILLLSLLMAAGCTRRPSEILSEKEMISLMADMQLAESYANLSDEAAKNPDFRSQVGKSVLAAHGVTQEQLDTTLSWYGRNLDDYSALYDKVDKRILARKKKLLKMTDEEMEMQEGDILWKYGKNGILSKLGNSDSWILSVPDPELQKGDRLQWSMHIDAPAQMNGVLGVEYSDGTSDAASSVFIGRNRIEIVCQTDTGKSVERIYGTLRVKDEQFLPVYADSISLIRLPYDSLEYNNRRNSKKYGIPVVRKPKKVEINDSVKIETEPSESMKPMEPKADEPVMWHPDGSSQELSRRRQNERIKPAKPLRSAHPDKTQPLMRKRERKS